MTLADFVAIHDLAVEAGVIEPVVFDTLDLAIVPVANDVDAGARFYAFARTLVPSGAALAAYRWFNVAI